MPSAAYSQWLAAGEPYELCRPVREFVDLLRAKGYTVYHKGDARHMQAVPPEDHTPFSATGWPITSARWVGHALDIMPNASLQSLSSLANRIIADRQNNVNGTQWIKYINWTDASGNTWQDRWMPTHLRTTNTDTGHIHISARSDMDASDVVSRSGYTPFRGASIDMGLTPSQEYIQHVLNHRVYGLVRGSDPVTVPAFTASDGSKFPPLSDANANDRALTTLLANTSADNLVQAFVAAIANRPEVVDALAVAVSSRIGMIPTAREIAKAIGELSWHGTPEA